MKKKLFVEKESQKFVLVSLHATVLIVDTQRRIEKKDAWWLVEHGDNNGKIVSSASLKNHFEEFKQ